MSKSLEKANARLAGIKSIDPNFDLGNGKTKAAYESSINACSDADEKYNIFLEKQKALDGVSEGMLIAVADKYGKDSNEYEKAGGVRKSEKKKPTKKKTSNNQPVPPVPPMP